MINIEKLLINMFYSTGVFIATPNITQLDLSQNFLTELPLLEGPDHLKVLNMSGQNVANFNIRTMGHLTTLEVLNVSRNNLGNLTR